MKNRKAKMLIAKPGSVSVSQIGLLFTIDIWVLGVFLYSFLRCLAEQKRGAKPLEKPLAH